MLDLRRATGRDQWVDEVAAVTVQVLFRVAVTTGISAVGVTLLTWVWRHR